MEIESMMEYEYNKAHDASFRLFADLRRNFASRETYK